ncbi:hypothetical protein GMO_18660 [Gluconobacter morbifer G707]|uniref:Uncharacterized protein n=1 Tax=Gluconobacter morbifer G707 TaxID=1088869 RepID=G6XJJ4_9PROT|nr:hypothetical protein GMO_18660 [Gluconobacter morbifer G707]
MRGASHLGYLRGILHRFMMMAWLQAINLQQSFGSQQQKILKEAI